MVRLGLVRLAQLPSPGGKKPCGPLGPPLVGPDPAERDRNDNHSHDGRSDTGHAEYRQRSRYSQGTDHARPEPQGLLTAQPACGSERARLRRAVAL